MALVAGSIPTGVAQASASTRRATTKCSASAPVFSGLRRVHNAPAALTRDVDANSMVSLQVCSSEPQSSHFCQLALYALSRGTPRGIFGVLSGWMVTKPPVKLNGSQSCRYGQSFGMP